MARLSNISNDPSEKLIQATLETFQPFYDQALTRDDAIEIIESLVNVSEIFLELAEESEISLSPQFEKVTCK